MSPFLLAPLSRTVKKILRSERGPPVRYRYRRVPSPEGMFTFPTLLLGASRKSMIVGRAYAFPRNHWRTQPPRDAPRRFATGPRRRRFSGTFPAHSTARWRLFPGYSPCIWRRFLEPARRAPGGSLRRPRPLPCAPPSPRQVCDGSAMAPRWRRDTAAFGSHSAGIWRRFLERPGPGCPPAVSGDG